MTFNVTNLYGRRATNRWERISVGDIWERICYSYPEKEALVGKEGAFAHQSNARLTYQQAEEKANRFANGLIHNNLDRGDRVLLFCANSVEAFLSKVAIAKAGMVAVPVNTMMAPDIISYIIKLVEPRFTIVDSEFWPKVEKVFQENKLNLDLSIPIGGKTIKGSQTIEEFIADQSPIAPEVEIHGDDIWEMLFTSGTTTLPKCVMISHIYTYMAANSFALSLTRGLHIECDLKLCSFLPVIFHIADQIFACPAFLAGGTLIIGRNLDMHSLASAITEEGVTALWAGSPQFLTGLADTFWSNRTKYDAHSLKVIVYGWAALNPEYAKKLKDLCGQDLTLFEILGQTEAISSFRFWPDKWPEIYEQTAPVLNYVGVPNPLLASVIMDEQGNVITKPSVPGEAVYRSPAMMAGYYKDEEATKKAFEHGWFHSGDCCMYDEYGLRIMIDRYKDVIKSGGENVSSIRVESVLAMHPKVARVAVIGIPHSRWGEMVTAVVILKEGENVNEEELITFCRGKLSGYETPKKIVFTDTLPETVGGKVLKYKLRAQFQNLTQG